MLPEANGMPTQDGQTTWKVKSIDGNRNSNRKGGKWDSHLHPRQAGMAGDQRV